MPSRVRYDEKFACFENASIVPVIEGRGGSGRKSPVHDHHVALVHDQDLLEQGNSPWNKPCFWCSSACRVSHQTGRGEGWFPSGHGRLQAHRWIAPLGLPGLCPEPCSLPSCCTDGFESFALGARPSLTCHSLIAFSSGSWFNWIHLGVTWINWSSLVSLIFSRRWRIQGWLGRLTKPTW